MDLAAKISFSDENQRAISKFLFLQGHSAAGIHRQLVDVLGTRALNERTVRRCCQQFKEGNWDVREHRGGDHKSTPQTEEQVETIVKALDDNKAWSLRALSANFGIPRTTCHRIITKNLKMRKVNAKWVPHELSPSQKETRVVYSTCNLRNFNQQKSRLQHTVAIDETWVSFFRPPEKDQAKVWLRKGEKRPSLAVADRYEPKVMVILAMDIKGICGYEILPKKETVNGSRYLSFLKKLMNEWRGDRRHSVWLLDDNARSHRKTEVIEWIEENNIERWLQPPYSPDLSPCDYGCFRALKRAIGGVHYANVESLVEAIENEIRHGNAEGKYLAVERLPERWLQCVNNKGEYL